MPKCTDCKHEWHGESCNSENCPCKVNVFVLADADLPDEEYDEDCLNGRCDCKVSEFVMREGG